MKDGAIGLSYSPIRFTGLIEQLLKPDISNLWDKIIRYGYLGKIKLPLHSIGSPHDHP